MAKKFDFVVGESGINVSKPITFAEAPSVTNMELSPQGQQQVDVATADKPSFIVGESGININKPISPARQPQDFGIRNDGTKKGLGFFGPIDLPDGNVATEFSIGVNFDGRETEIPTLVPTLSAQEKDLLVNDIIPNKKEIPQGIVNKAIEHAKSRIKQGRSPFAETATPRATDPSILATLPSAPGIESLSQETITPAREVDIVGTQNIPEIEKLISGLNIPRTESEFAQLEKEVEREKRNPRPGVLGGDISPPKERELRTELLSRKSFQRLQDEFGLSPDEISSLKAAQLGTEAPSQKFRTAGSIAGSLVAGTVIPGPVDEAGAIATILRVGGQSVSAALGGVAGTVADIKLDPARDITKEELVRVAREEGGAELFGSALGEFGTKLFGRAGRLPVDEVDELDAFLRQAADDPEIDKILRQAGIKKKELFLPAGAATDLPSAETADAIVAASILSSNQAARKKNVLQRVARVKAERLPTEIGKNTLNLTPRQTTDLAVKIITDNEDMADSAATLLYNKLDEIIEATKGTKTVTKTVPSQILQESGRPFTREVSEEVATIGGKVDLSGLGEKAAQEILDFEEALGLGFEGGVKTNLQKLAKGRGKEVNFATAQKMRSRLLKQKRDLLRGQSPNTILRETLDNGIDALDAAMSKAAKGLGEEAGSVWREANKIWRTNRELFNSEVVADIIRNRPNNAGLIFEILSQGDEEKVGLIVKAIKRGKGGAKVFDDVKNGYLTSIFKQAEQVDDAVKSGRKLVGEKALDVWTRTPEGVRKQIYGADADKITKSLRTLSLVEQQAKSGGLVGIRSAQALGVAGLFALPFAGGEGDDNRLGAISATTGVLLVGPEVLARLLLKKPRFAQLLGKGFKIPANTRQGVINTARLGKFVLAERKAIQKERQKTIKTKLGAIRKKKETEKRRRTRRQTQSLQRQVQ